MSSLTAGVTTSTSIGPAGQLFALLLQSIVADRAAVSPPEMWPPDRGPVEKGLFSHYLALVI